VSLILFWTVVAVIAYTYVVFPALVMLRGLVCPRRIQSADHEPTVSLVIVAHNEALAIEAKLFNILALDYPADRLEVVIASDGSTDDTNAIVRRFANRGVKLLALPRQGKIPALNAAVAATTGEVLVFSDANSMYAPDAVRAIVRPLADPLVGGVAGDQRYVRDRRGANAGERSYWSFDRLLKRAQSRAGSATSATGAIYALRRDLFQPVPGSVTDDFFASTSAIAHGYRLVFAEQAVAFEPAAHRSHLEFARKVRVTTRGLYAVLARRALLNPLRHGFYAFQLFSHKVLRRLMFAPLVVLLLVTPLLWSQGIVYQAALVLQAALYTAAALGGLLAETRPGQIKLVSLPYYFCLVNAAALLATLNVLRGRRIDIWEPQRTGSVVRAAAGLALSPTETPRRHVPC
jgi:cellulose synthase/poly-beta-1,6-N-acetylglucosamine synthase-like glycosyltransferase